MVQTFQAVRCFSCQTFQISMLKKTPKWSCKVCGEKQSLKQVFYQGTSSDCRVAVQQFNTKAGLAEISKNKQILLLVEEEEKTQKHEERISQAPLIDETPAYSDQKKSKWMQYIDTSSTLDDDDDGVNIGHNQTTSAKQPYVSPYNKTNEITCERNPRKQKRDVADSNNSNSPIISVKKSKWNSYIESSCDTQQSP